MYHEDKQMLRDVVLLPRSFRALSSWHREWMMCYHDKWVLSQSFATSAALSHSARHCYQVGAVPVTGSVLTEPS